MNNEELDDLWKKLITLHNNLHGDISTFVTDNLIRHRLLPDVKTLLALIRIVRAETVKGDSTSMSIKTYQEYLGIMKVIEQFMDAEDETWRGAVLNVLVRLVEEYEENEFGD